MNKLFFIIALALTLAGCDNMPIKPSPPPKVVYEKINPALLVKCYITPPQKTSTYSVLSTEAKLDVMTKYATTLLGDLDNCNIRMGEVNLANEKKDKLFNPGDGSK